MKAFAELCKALDLASTSAEKILALEGFFATASTADTRWAQYLLAGSKIQPRINPAQLKYWAILEAQIPNWLFADCQDLINDLVEVCSLIVSQTVESKNHSLDYWLKFLENLDENDKQAGIISAWREQDPLERLVFNQLATGTLKLRLPPDISLNGHTHPQQTSFLELPPTAKFTPTAMETGWEYTPEKISTILALLVYGQRGVGKQRHSYILTFAVWEGAQLVPITKVEMQTSDERFSELHKWMKENTLEKFGPVRSLRPDLVFELQITGVKPSARHKAGIAVREPRILRQLDNMLPTEADNIAKLKSLC